MQNRIIAEHVIKKNDTLSAIALKYYGSTSKDKWMSIVEANQGLIDPKTLVIQPGWKIKIPDLNSTEEKENSSMTVQNSPQEDKLGFNVPVISYDVPEPTSYSGVNIIQLDLPVNYFTKRVAPDFALKFGQGGNSIYLSKELNIREFEYTIEAWVKGGTGDITATPFLSIAPDRTVGFHDRGLEIRTENTIPETTWVHLAAVVGNSEEPSELLTNVIRMYVNGDEWKSEIKHHALEAPTFRGFRVGGNEVFWNGYYNGQVDEVRVWNVARTPEQIRANMNQDVVDQEGLVLYWRFNEGQGDTIHDSSGDGNDGKISSNAVQWVASTRPLLSDIVEQDSPDGDALRLAWQRALEGDFDPKVFPNLGWVTPELKQASVAAIKNVNEDDFINHYNSGERLQLYRTTGGALEHRFVPLSNPNEYQPSLYLIERYRLSSYLGMYGAGRTISTFTLLPGEKTSIVIDSYKSSEDFREKASSIFDSYTDSSAKEFEQAISSESSSKITSETYKAYQSDTALSSNIAGSMEASWGWGSAELSTSLSASESKSHQNSSNNARTEFAKNVSNAAAKHAAAASSRRDINLTNTATTKTVDGKSELIERQIENINKSRTLNFVFRQMNQEFYTILHLYDVRVAASGIPPVPLSSLDEILEVTIKEEHHAQVRELIRQELLDIKAYSGEPVSGFIKQITPSGSTNGQNPDEPYYLAVNHQFTTQYTDPISRYSINVPGVLINVQKIIMRTDGVMAEALLGQSPALDEHQDGLMDEELRARRLDNALAELRLKILEDGDQERANLYNKIFQTNGLG